MTLMEETIYKMRPTKHENIPQVGFPVCQKLAQLVTTSNQQALFTKKKKKMTEEIIVCLLANFIVNTCT